MTWQEPIRDREDPRRGTASRRHRAICAACSESSYVHRMKVVGGERLCPTCVARRYPALEPERVPAPRWAPTPRVRRPAAASSVRAERPHASWDAALFADMQAWTHQASWAPRLPVLLLIVYWAVRHAADSDYRSVLGALNLGVHELGHAFFATFGMLPGIAGGTVLQLAAPLVAIWMFLGQRDYFAISFAFAWLASNLYDVARYVADARSQLLPLVGLGSGEPLHDWAYMLGRLGLLEADHALAGLLRLGGLLAFATALWLGGWLVVSMVRHPHPSA